MQHAATLRAEQRMIEADDAIAQARALAPADPLIAFLHAQSRFELGHPAAALFTAAQQLWPANPDVLRNRALALAAEDDFPAAEALLADALAANPGWLDGHRVLAGLRWTFGNGTGFDASYVSAIAAQPNSAALWLGWFSAAAQHRDWPRATTILDSADAALGDGHATRTARAFVAVESGDEADARALLAALADHDDDFTALCRIRFHLRQREFALAEAAALAMSKGAGAGQAWPYLSAIWRCTGDPRAAWLDGDPPYVSEMTVNLSAAEMTELAATLRSLHRAQRPYAEQSVRGGTQTDRSLLLRHEPILQRARTALMAQVHDYIAALPPSDPAHPLLGRPRTAPRIAGSWSVRLSGGGHNVAHSHPLGWISSAFYVALPAQAERGSPPAGHLALGAPPPELGLDLAPYRTIAPAIGKLVLFPATLWHGTLPYPAGERLNIAFDIIVD
jgi:tetratricopeptide (TPR) repeat protein